MLKTNDLKVWLHKKELRQLDKLLLILATFDEPAKLAALKSRAREGGLKISTSWNPSSTLRRSEGLAISTPAGWELTETGVQHLRNLGVSDLSPSAQAVAHDLRKAASLIEHAQTRAFLVEAIACYEHKLHRAAVIMSWVGAVSLLHARVHALHLASFNTAMRAKDAKWKDAQSTDDLGRAKEYDFIQTLGTISVVGKNVKDELLHRLQLRNGCGHPNDMRIGQNTVAHHIEWLVNNVYAPFS